MSLLNGRMTVNVYPLTREVNEWGEETVREGEPVPTQCVVQWQTATETGDLTVSPATQIIILARDWAGSENCRIEYDGAWFEQIGATTTFKGSARTAHFRVFARLISNRG